MNSRLDADYIAFDGDHRIAAGDLRTVAIAAKRILDRKKQASILIFDRRTSHPVEIDFRGSAGDVMTRLPDAPPSPLEAKYTEQKTPRGPGRPRLGVVAREITLLPRHWDWLAQQEGGASVAIRKLVDQARRNNEDRERVCAAQDAAYRFMSVMAGNKAHFEDAIRALFAADGNRFEALIAAWPTDIREHSLDLAGAAFL